MILKCQCGATKQSAASGAYNVGEVKDETGWFPISLNDGGMSWLCPECFIKGREAIMFVIKLVGRYDFAPLSFVPKKHCPKCNMMYWDDKCPCERFHR